MTPLLLDEPTRAPATPGRAADVVVIGAGQAGLSAAYHLQRRGFRSALTGEEGPGGAWRHRWDSLRMATVNGIHDLPGMEQPPPDAAEPSNSALPRYFAEYEERFDLPVLRPVRVESVERVDADPLGPLRVRTGRGTWLTRAVVNATGTWGRPYWPYYPGRETFLGRQLHTADYVSAEEFAGQHVVVVGGGISAVQFLEERSEERRVGKECRSRWWAYRKDKKTRKHRHT